MIKNNVGKYNCGVSSCQGVSCVHDWIPLYCPFCQCQLVHVTKNDLVFCSNHESICDYSSSIEKSKDFMSAHSALEVKKEEAINERKALLAKIEKIDIYLNRINENECERLIL